MADCDFSVSTTFFEERRIKDHLSRGESAQEWRVLPRTALQEKRELVVGFPILVKICGGEAQQRVQERARLDNELSDNLR